MQHATIKLNNMDVKCYSAHVLHKTMRIVSNIMECESNEGE